MAKHEKISEERKKLIKEFINQNNITTAKDIEEALKNMFKDTLQEMLEAEMTTQLLYFTLLVDFFVYQVTCLNLLVLHHILVPLLCMMLGLWTDL